MSRTAPLILISDVHGCYYTLLRLLAQCAKRHPGAKLAFLGDLIDRGPHSRLVVEFAMWRQIPTVIGNHEDLCLAFYDPFPATPPLPRRAHCGGYYDRGVWLDNGGDLAVPGWKLIDKRRLTGPQIAQAESLGGRVPDDVLDWMAALPAYLIPDVEPDSSGRRLLLSHTGYGLAAKEDTPEAWMTALWGRHGLDAPEFPEDGYYRVFGHTQRREPVITDSYAMIDTGAAYVKRGMGVLTAFVWPTKEVLQERFDETPVDLQLAMDDGRLAA